MWLPSRQLALGVILAGLAGVAPAGAGLYGFTSENPYTHEEELLGMDVAPRHIVNYRKEMRDNLLMMIDFARARRPEFQVVAHEGGYLMDKSLWEYHLEGYNAARQKEVNAEDPAFLVNPKNLPGEDEPQQSTSPYRYLHALSGIALNDLYCGNNRPSKLVTENKIPVIAIDQCASDEAMDKAIIASIQDKRPLYGFTDPDYAFVDISSQPVINESAKNIETVGEARNILMLTDDHQYRTKEQLIHDLAKTSYDIIVMKPVFHRRHPFEAEELRRLQFKRNGARRLLLAEMNVSEANPYDYYWNKNWEIGKPAWLARPSFVDKNSVIVRYWAPEWQQILSQHFKGIVDSHFDGVLFTGLNNNQYFEKQTPLE